MIKLNGQDVHVRQLGRQLLVPATQVGDVADRSTRPPSIPPGTGGRWRRATLQAKAEGGAAVVSQGQCPTAELRRELELCVRLERAHQAGRVQGQKTVRVRAQNGVMTGMAPQRDLGAM